MLRCRLQDGDISIVHSPVILRYIARKFDLYGSGEKQNLTIDMVLDGVATLRRFYFELAYTHNMVRVQRLRSRAEGLNTMCGALHRTPPAGDTSTRCT